MTFGHDDIRERLVEYLYEELEGPARAAFDAHLAACGTCRAETEAAGRARGVARAVVRAQLGEAVPLGLRARVLEASAHAARERARQAVVAAPVVTTPASPDRGPRPSSGEGNIPLRDRETSPRRNGPDRPGWQGWIGRLRGRWTLPTFATVGALAVFLLVRGTIFREARRPLGEAPAERIGARAPAPAAAPLRTPASRAPERPDDFEAGETKGALGSAGKRRALLEGTDDAIPGGGGDDDWKLKGKVPARHSLRVAVPSGGGRGEGMGREDEIGSGALHKMPSRPALRDANRNVPPVETSRPSGASVPEDGSQGGDRPDDLRNGLDVKSRAERRLAPVSGPAAASAPASGSVSVARRRSVGGGAAARDVEASAGPRPSPVVAPEREDDLLEGSAPSSRDDRAGFAQPPPAQLARPARVAPAPRSPTAPVAKASSTAPAPSLSRAAAAQPALPPPPLAPRASGGVRQEPSSSGSAGKEAKKRAADKSEAADETAGAPAATHAVDPAIALADRAAKLLAAGHFTEASAVYRDLLRRFPAHPSAPLWRARLAASDHAAASDPTPFAAPPPPR